MEKVFFEIRKDYMGGDPSMDSSKNCVTFKRERSGGRMYKFHLFASFSSDKIPECLQLTAVF